MPSAIKYIPPTDSQRGAYTSEITLERAARRLRYLTALKCFNGKYDDQLDPVDPDDDNEPNDNVKINLVKMTADRTVSFLFPKMPRFRTDQANAEPSDEEKWLIKAFDANGGLNLMTKMGLRGFLAGMTYLRVKKNPDGGYPTLTLLDPLAITTFWHADDVGDVLWYENRYIVGKDIYIQDYVKNDTKPEWDIYTYKSAASADLVNGAESNPNGAGQVPRSFALDFVSGNRIELLLTRTGSEFAVHASPLPPIVEIMHLPHPDDYYGHGEVNEIDLNDTINRLWSLVNRIAREHSEPTDVITGADVDDVESGKNVMTIAAAEARVQRLEMKGDMGTAVETVNKLIETYLATARVVLLRGDVRDLQRVTNASVRTLFIDAIAKNSVLRDSYGRGLIKASKLMMQMSDQPFAAKALDVPVECLFADALPVDLTEIANQNAILVPLGARSPRTAAEAMGDDWTQEKTRLDEAHADSMKKQNEQMTMQQKFAPPTSSGAGKPTPKPGAQAPKTSKDQKVY